MSVNPTQDTAITDSQLRDVLLEYRRENWEGIQPADVQERIVDDILQSDCNLLLQRIAPYLQLCSESTVLDIGSGVGSFVVGCRERDLLAFGIEPDRIGQGGRLTAIQIASRRLGDQIFVAGLGERLPFADESFDLVTVNQVIEHVADQPAVLREASRVVKGGGVVYIACPNYLRLYEPHYKIFWLPLMPKWLGRWYLRLRGRNPVMLDQLTYTTNGRLRALLRGLGREYEIIDLHREEFLRKRVCDSFGSLRAKAASKITWLPLVGPFFLHLVLLCVSVREAGSEMIVIRKPAPKRSPC